MSPFRPSAETHRPPENFGAHVGKLVSHIRNRRVINHKTLKETFDIVFVNGLTVVGAMFHEHDGGKRWFAMPCKEYLNSDGSTGKANLISFEPGAKEQLKAELTEALGLTEPRLV